MNERDEARERSYLRLYMTFLAPIISSNLVLRLEWDHARLGLPDPYPFLMIPIVKVHLNQGVPDTNKIGTFTVQMQRIQYSEPKTSCFEVASLTVWVI